MAPDTRKLICFDLDGTLLDRNKQVQPINLQLLASLVDAGHVVSIATGRLYKSACKVRHLIPTPIEIICSNGAVIEEAGLITRRDQISLPDLAELYDLTREHRLSLAFVTLYSVYHTQLVWALRMNYFSNVINKGSLVIRNVHVRDRDEYMRYAPYYINGILISRNHPERIQALRRDLETMGRFNIESSAPDNVEIIPRGSDKGSAALILARRHQINREDIIAFGDGENDLKLIQTAGTSFAMANACDDLKQAADYIIGHHTTDTIARTLSELLNLNLK